MGISIKNNFFTNVFPTFVVPMGTDVVKVVEIDPEKEIYRVNFDRQIPLGIITSATFSTVYYEGDRIPVVAIREMRSRTVVLSAVCYGKDRVQIEVSSSGPYAKRFDYVVR